MTESRPAAAPLKCSDMELGTSEAEVENSTPPAQASGIIMTYVAVS